MPTLRDLIILGPVLTLVALAFAVFLAIRRKDVFAARLYFSPGVVPMEQRKLLPRRQRKLPVSNVIILFRPQLEQNFILLPITVQAVGRHPIKNIGLKITMPLANHVANEKALTLKECTRFEVSRDVKGAAQAATVSLAFAMDDYYGRRSWREGPVGRTSYEISLLRPGEGIILTEPIMISLKTNHRSANKFARNSYNLLLSKNLRDVAECFDFFETNFHIVAENVQPIEQTIRVIGFALNRPE